MGDMNELSDTEALMQQLTEAAPHQNTEYASRLMISARAKIRHLSKPQAPKVKALIWTPWPDNKVDYLHQSCTTENPFFDGHIVLKGEIYELHIDDEYHNSYSSLEAAKDAAHTFFAQEILDQIEV